MCDLKIEDLQITKAMDAMENIKGGQVDTASGACEGAGMPEGIVTPHSMSIVLFRHDGPPDFSATNVSLRIQQHISVALRKAILLNISLTQPN